MAKWFVQIAGDESDLKKLVQVMNSDTLEIIQDNNEYYLLSTEFDRFVTAAQVNTTALFEIVFLGLEKMEFEIG
jgi:hypothetical protein